MKNSYQILRYSLLKFLFCLDPVSPEPELYSGMTSAFFETAIVKY